MQTRNNFGNSSTIGGKVVDIANDFSSEFGQWGDKEEMG